MAGKKRAGKGSGVSVNAVQLSMADFTVTQRADDLDTTDQLDSGHESGIVGCDVAEFDFSGDWDAAANRYDDPPGIFVRDDFENLKLYLSVADNTYWDLPVNRLLSTANTAPVKGKVGFRAAGKSNGAGVVRPTGSV